MKNMKKGIVLAVVAMAALVSHGSYLYWQVDNTKEAIDFEYATVSLEKTAGSGVYDKLTVWTDQGDTGLTDVYASDVEIGERGYQTEAAYSSFNGADLVTQYQGAMLVEMWTSNPSGSGSPVCVARQVVDQGMWKFSVYSDMQTTGATPFVAHGTPEPTSGLLSLFALAMLALRRKSRLKVGG